MPPAVRVLIAADSLLPIASGIGRVARLTTRLLVDEAHAGRLSVRAVALVDDRPAHDLGVPITACAGSRARFVFECQRAAVDCTHFIYDFAGMARAHPWWYPRHRPSLVWVHGIEVWEDARRDRLRALRRADALVANTAYTKQRAEALHGCFGRARVCWLATESNEVPAPVAAPNSRANVLLLGRIDPGGGRKGHRELVHCWPNVVREIPHARLLIAGGGRGTPIVNELVERSPVRDSIDLLGFIPEPEVESLWSRADVFAMPSRGEGLGLAYIEAMRHGLPVIGSVHDAAVEINLHGITGFNVDLRVENQLASRVIELLSDRALARSMGGAGQARWQTHFRYEAFRGRMQPILAGFLRA